MSASPHNHHEAPPPPGQPRLPAGALLLAEASIQRAASSIGAIMNFDPEDFDGLVGETKFEQIALIFLRAAHRQLREQHRKIEAMEKRVFGLEVRAVVYGSIAGVITAICGNALTSLLIHKLTN